MGTSTVADGPGARAVEGAGSTADDTGAGEPGGDQPPGELARGRRPALAGAVVLTVVALVLTVAFSTARADTAERLGLLTQRLDRQAVVTHRTAEQLMLLLSVAEETYAASSDADPVAREALGEALEEARTAARLRVADEPPATVRQAQGRLEQARTIDESLRWAAQDLSDALGAVVGDPRPLLASAG